MGVTEGVSWGELAAEPASLAQSELSGMAMKEPLASTGPLVTSTFASACNHAQYVNDASEQHSVAEQHASALSQTRHISRRSCHH